MIELLGWAFFGGLALLIFAIFVGLGLTIIVTLVRSAPLSKKDEALRISEIARLTGPQR